MENQTYTIQELSQITGLPRRTIHFYSQQGILPSPDGAGAGSTYNENHLVRLKLIPILRSQGKRLDQIREVFNSLDIEELRQQLLHRNLSEPIPPSPLNETTYQPYFHYVLPAGLTLAVPADIHAKHSAKIDRLLKLARQLFPESENSQEKNNGNPRP